MLINEKTGKKEMTFYRENAFISIPVTLVLEYFF